MAATWKIRAPATLVAVCCVAAILWPVLKERVTQRTLADTARASRARAEKGDANAENRLGNLYLNGQGVPQDAAEAVRWYRRAAEQGYPRAQFNLGSMYQYGRGASKDYAEALDWYHKAADQGEPNAEFGLGFMYYEGQGVHQDYADAIRWYRKAADQGYARAQYALGFMYFHGQGVLQDRAEAARWFRKAADQGDDDALRALGLKGARSSPWSRIDLWVIFFGSAFFLIDSLPRGKGFREWPRRIAALFGALGMAYLGLTLYGLAQDDMRAFGHAGAFYLTKLSLAGLAAVVCVLWLVVSKGGREQLLGDDDV